VSPLRRKISIIRLEKKDGLRISKDRRVKFIRLWFADILAGVTHDELNKYFSILIKEKGAENGSGQTMVG
jgi:hypothetical protein